ncbi:MAG: hypothetical protein JXR76_16210 [Deltaproteobacteria bacterium]|nr:hypothetical protein [Deltaproteobacteria bacterium]
MNSFAIAVLSKNTFRVERKHYDAFWCTDSPLGSNDLFSLVMQQNCSNLSLSDTKFHFNGGTGAIHSPQGTCVVQNNIIWNNDILKELSESASADDVSYSLLESELDAEGTISGEPLFVNAPAATTITTEAANTQTVVLGQTRVLFNAGDWIEINNDGIFRTVSDVVDTDVQTIIFSPALNSPTLPGMRVDLWQDDTSDFVKKYSLMVESPRVDAAHALPYISSDDIDIVGNSRLVGEEQGMGAYELQQCSLCFKIATCRLPGRPF